MTAEKTSAAFTPPRRPSARVLPPALLGGPPRRIRTANARQSVSGEVRLPAYGYVPGGGPARPRAQGGNGPVRQGQTVYRPYEPAAAPRRPGSKAARQNTLPHGSTYARRAAARRRAAMRARRARRRLAAMLMLAGLFTGLLALHGLAPAPAAAAAGPADAALPSAAEPPAVIEPPADAGPPSAAEPSAAAEPPAVIEPPAAAELPATGEAAVMARLDALRERYPQGCYWNHAGPDLNGCGVTEVACPSHGSYATCNSYAYHGDISYQCKGFAKTIFKEVFGQEPDELPKNYDIENVMVGDYVRFGGEYAGHSFIVLERDGDEVTVLECNIGGRCIIQWGRVQSLGGALNYASASNPKYVYFSYSVHASNYDETEMPAGSALWEDPS